MAKNIYTKKQLEAMKVGELRKLSVFKKLNLYKLKKAEAIEAILKSQEAKPKKVTKSVAKKVEVPKVKQEEKVVKVKQEKEVVNNKQEKSEKKEPIFKRFRLKISKITFR